MRSGWSSAPKYNTRFRRRTTLSHSYQDGGMTITRFNTADWPAVQEDIVKMTRDVLSRSR
jgi:hypothetical protein